jgi:threonyl-tRNA synthetase
VNITLPDGKVLTFARGVTGADVAAKIGPGLAKAALAVQVDGKDWDIFRPIEHDAKLRIITRKDDAALEMIRHDTAHVLAMAVQELFPGTQVTIGPAIEDGFYYDFARAEPFHPDDLPKIEAKMREIVARDLPTRRTVWPRDEAIRHFEEIGEHYKAELIRDLPPGEQITVYYHGDWHDLCRGPHFASTGKIGQGFKLTKIAGAYWRGDAKNAQLQRIYGTAWRDEKELEAYLKRIEEAEKRDHRKLGREMDLFHMQEEAVGQVFWHPKGYALYHTLEDYIRRKLGKTGYQEVKTPLLIDRKLWELSGHWANYRQNMFVAEVEDEEKTLAVKPMNCPGHVQIFKQGTKSYRELPLRLAEFGSCHRYEPSGALHGIMRVRAFTQDDAHIFCTHEQITDETIAFCKLLMEIYRDLGFRGRAGQAGDSARQPDRERRDLGPGGIGAQASDRDRGVGLHAQSRRGRVLRAEAGIRVARFDRARLAVRHAASRLQHRRPAGRDLCRRRRGQTRTCDAPPRHSGIDGALHRGAHRALCGQVPAVARASTSGGGHYRLRR